MKEYDHEILQQAVRELEKTVNVLCKDKVPPSYIVKALSYVFMAGCGAVKMSEAEFKFYCMDLFVKYDLAKLEMDNINNED